MTERRIRIGQYLVVYGIDDARVVVTPVNVTPRGEAYRQRSPGRDPRAGLW